MMILLKPGNLILAMTLLAASGCTAQRQLTLLEQAQYAKDPDTITLELNNYLPGSNRSFRHLFVSNFSVKAGGGQLEYSTARDGLTDALRAAHESDYGMVKESSDWNNDGFGDLLMYLAGITAPNQTSLYCGPAQRISSSNDAFTFSDTRFFGSPSVLLGLRDCEKVFLQLDPQSFDYDGDGIPDYLELRAGLNPKNPGDADLSVTGDGISNIEKVKRNIPVNESADSQPNRLFAYKYETNFTATGARKFTVSNIPVLNGGRDNFIAIYLTETDLTSKKDKLFSAFLILPVNSAGRKISINYWGNDPSLGPTNEEITVP